MFPSGDDVQGNDGEVGMHRTGERLSIPISPISSRQRVSWIEATSTSIPPNAHDNHRDHHVPSVPHIVTPPRNNSTVNNENTHMSHSSTGGSSVEHQSSSMTSATNNNNSSTTIRRTFHIPSTDLDDSNHEDHHHDNHIDDDTTSRRFHDIRSKFENRSSLVSAVGLSPRNRTSLSPRETLINQIKEHDSSPERSPNISQKSPNLIEQRVLIKEVIGGRVVTKEVLVDSTPPPIFSSPARTGISSELPTS